MAKEDVKLDLKLFMILDVLDDLGGEMDNTEELATYAGGCLF